MKLTKKTEEGLYQKTQDYTRKLDELYKKRSEIAETIDKCIIRSYNRISQNRNGLAIVKVINNSCEACNISLPPQFIIEIKRATQIHTCPNCCRLLYTEENLT